MTAEIKTKCKYSQTKRKHVINSDWDRNIKIVNI